MKKSILLLSVFVILVGCSPSPEAIGQALSMTQTALPTQTPYPTYTPQPTIVKIVIQTPKPDYLSSDCKPITNMIYGDLYKEINILKSYVETLPDVKVTTYELPEQLYSNTKSHLVFIDYISKKMGKLMQSDISIYRMNLDGKIQYFSLDGQCWIDH